MAHTADDQAETLLLGALRGRVTGMNERSEVERPRGAAAAERAPRRYRRRLRGVGPFDVAGPTERGHHFRRVALRREVIPQLSRIIGGDAVPALAQAASDAALDDAALRTLPTTDCAELAAMAEPRRRRAIAAWLVSEG